jgi:hypothetical protein
LPAEMETAALAVAPASDSDDARSVQTCIVCTPIKTPTTDRDCNDWRRLGGSSTSLLPVSRAGRRSHPRPGGRRGREINQSPEHSGNETWTQSRTAYFRAQFARLKRAVLIDVEPVDYLTHESHELVSHTTLLASWSIRRRSASY